MSGSFLTEFEVAERTRISVATLRRWRLEKRGPRYSKFGSLVRYGESDLVEWQQAQPSGGEGLPHGIAVKSARSGVLLRKSG
jgi:predicted DNA-binding transcriptional regulator AlpA